MNELSPEARRILGLARRGDELLETDRARLDHRMARRLALAAGVTGTTLGTAKVATGTAILSTMLGKGLVTGTLVVVAAAGGWKATEHFALQHRSAPAIAMASAPTPNLAPKPPTATEQRAELPSVQAARPLDEGAVTVQPAPPGVQPAPPLGATAVTAPLASRDVAAANQPKKNQPHGEQQAESEAEVTEPASVGPTDPLQAEVAALREAQRAMSAGQTEHALRLIAEQDKSFASGSLVQERAAAKIFAWCNLGRVAEARVGAGAFERRWPRSPLISRVRRACDSDAKE